MLKFTNYGRMILDSNLFMVNITQTMVIRGCFLWIFVDICFDRKTLTWHWIVITKPSRGLHEQCWHHLWSPQKSVHYNLLKICPRKFTQKEEFLWKKMSTRIHTKCPRELTLRKCSLEFAHFEKSVHENSLSMRSLHPGYQLSCVEIDSDKTFVICLKKGRTWCS